MSKEFGEREEIVKGDRIRRRDKMVSGLGFCQASLLCNLFHAFHPAQQKVPTPVGSGFSPRPTPPPHSFQLSRLNEAV
jgi:hypothetical protein